MDRQIFQLEDPAAFDNTFMVAVQKADGSEEATKIPVSQLISGGDKLIKISLSAAELLSMFTTPVEVLPAVAGKLYVPKFAFLRYTYGTIAYFYASGTFRFAYGEASNWVVNFSAGIITANDDAQSLLNVTPSGPSYTGPAGSGGYHGRSLLLLLTNQDPITGNGDLDIYLTYTEITL